MLNSENKLLTGRELKKWDQFTIRNLPITSIDLMEKAALTCVSWINRYFPYQNRFHILCGKGNNGGDGLAIARILSGMGKTILVGIIEEPEIGSADFESNFSKIKALDSIADYKLDAATLSAYLEESDLVIDALLGSGTNRTCVGELAHCIAYLNKQTNLVISIDLPSGLSADKFLDNSIHNTVKADFTLCFQLPKLSFFLPETGNFTGQIEILEIGLLPEYLSEIPGKTYFINKELAGNLVKTRGKFDHKGTFGHALILAGSKGKMGAALIAGKSALRSGLGLLTMAVTEESDFIIQTGLPEAMTFPGGTTFISRLPDLTAFKSIGIGPGIGFENETQQVLLEVLKSGKKVILDADALIILSSLPDWEKLIPSQCILTPHPKEFDRLFGICSNHEERIGIQIQKAIQLNCVLILKGGHTSIAFPDGRVYFNTSGNPGMATGGSGDSLTGLLTGLLAQGYSTEDASILGVFVHGLAADLALKEQSEESLLPTDFIACFGKAFQLLKEIRE